MRYAFVTGWNPKTKKVFQWGAGGNGEIYGFQQRIGTCDPETKTWSAKAEGILSNDAKHTNAVKLTIVDDKTLTLDSTDNTMNDKKTPDVHVVFSPQVDLTTPQFDETPGPGYERLKPIEWLVGDWNVRGKWADGKLHEGEEHSEWVFNKNFIKGDGWWKDRDGKRIDYLYLIAWDPTAKKILMPIISSDGGHDVRTGEYDPQTKTIASRQEGVLGTGEEVCFEQLTRLVDQNAFEWIGTKIESGNEDLPDLKIRFSRK